jgi:hypothetical protein
MAEPRSGASRVARTPKPVRVWAEVGVTIAVTEDPPQFIRFSFGHEKIAPNDDQETIKRYEALVYETCEAVVERRIRRLKRLVRSTR